MPGYDKYDVIIGYLNSAVKRFNSLKTMCPQTPDVKKEIDAYKSFLDALEAKYAVG